MRSIATVWDDFNRLSFRRLRHRQKLEEKRPNDCINRSKGRFTSSFRRFLRRRLKSSQTVTIDLIWFYLLHYYFTMLLKDNLNLLICLFIYLFICFSIFLVVYIFIYLSILFIYFIYLINYYLKINVFMHGNLYNLAQLLLEGTCVHTCLENF